MKSSADILTSVNLVEMLVQAGITLDGFADFFKTLEDLGEKNPGWLKNISKKIPDFMSTHPNSAKRAALIKSHSFKSNDEGMDRESFEILKKACVEKNSSEPDAED